MATKQPHLEFRATGYYWRRRVPASAKFQVTADPALSAPVRILDGTILRIIDIWDYWLDDKSRGVRSDGIYSFENDGEAPPEHGLDWLFFLERR